MFYTNVRFWTATNCHNISWHIEEFGWARILADTIGKKVWQLLSNIFNLFYDRIKFQKAYTSILYKMRSRILQKHNHSLIVHILCLTTFNKTTLYFKQHFIFWHYKKLKFNFYTEDIYNARVLLHGKRIYFA